VSRLTRVLLLAAGFVVLTWVCFTTLFPWLDRTVFANPTL